MADGNITINSSAPSDDPSMVMQGLKRFNFKNLNLFSTKTIMKKMSQENTSMTIQIYLLILRKVLYAQENQMDTSLAFKRELADIESNLLVLI